MANHGVYVFERSTSLATPVVAATGIPFVVGVAPIHSVDHPAAVGVPVLITSWDEFTDQLGYCEDWDTYPLAEFGYSQFVLFNMQPAIFLNLFDPSTMKAAKTAADYDVVNHKVNLGAKALNDASVLVKDKAATPNTLVKGTDYDVYFVNGEMIVELLSTGGYYSEAKLTISYNEAVFTSINATAVATAFDKVDLCMGSLGVVPDMLCAPGWSDKSAVAAVMASKAGSINGLWRAKALIDIPCDSVSGATVYSSVVAKKNTLAMTDPNQEVCWPMIGLGGKKYHFSTQLAGLHASVDTENRAPYVSPSNHGIKADSLVLADGTEVLMTKAHADILNAGGVITGLNFMGGYVCWGNYTACYPVNTDVKDYFIPISRMFDWVANTLIRTFWSQLDKPMTRRLIDTIIDSANIWLNGLVGSGYLLGARVEALESENPVTNLMAGIINFHVYLTPPSPAQEIDFTLEYDASYVTAALQA